MLVSDEVSNRDTTPSKIKISVATYFLIPSEPPLCLSRKYEVHNNNQRCPCYRKYAEISQCIGVRLRLILILSNYDFSIF
jgi:hypothetical protein